MKNLVKAETKVLNDRIPEIQAAIITNLGTSLPFVPKIAGYLLEARYDTFRSQLTVRCASLFDEADQVLFDIVSILEFLDASSLLHRHVRNPEKARRKLRPIQDIWGNEASVLLGDYLLSISFEILTRSGNLDILQTISAATQKIALGQMLEVSNPFQNATPQDWWKVTEKKTASLFEAGALCAAKWGNATTEIGESLRNFAKYLCMAAQLHKDLRILSKKESLNQALSDEKLLYPVCYWLHKALSVEESSQIRQNLSHHFQGNGLDDENWERLIQASQVPLQAKMEKMLKLARSQLESLANYDCSPLIQLTLFDDNPSFG